jgi:hypothetical protein
LFICHFSTTVAYGKQEPELENGQLTKIRKADVELNSGVRIRPHRKKE